MENRLRTVVYEDEAGYMHRTLIKSDMPDTQAGKGIPVDPPILGNLDWMQIEKELHNLLVRREYITLKNVYDSKGGLANVILSVIKPKIVQLYKVMGNNAQEVQNE